MSKKTLEELYVDLKRYHDDLDNDKSFWKFVDTMETIASKEDPSSIKVLMMYADDDSGFDFIDSQLLKVLEGFPFEDYVRELLTNIHLLIPKALNFAETALIRAVLSKRTWEFVKQYIDRVEPKSFLKILDYMDSINDWEPDDKRRLELRALLQSSINAKSTPTSQEEHAPTSS